MTRSILCVLVVLAFTVTGCAQGGSSQAEELRRTQLQTALASETRQVLIESHAPLRLTQAEFQDADGELWWIIQFDDPAETGAGSNFDSETLVFEAPLMILRAALMEHSTQLLELPELTTFIIAFREPEQTVYEIPADLMWDFVDGDINWRDVADEMLITSSSP